MIENKDIKASSNRDISKYEMNRVVVETYVSTRTITNNNTTSNINKILNFQNKDNNCDETVPTPSYSISQVNNINLIFHIKKFDLPLSTTNSSFNYLTQIAKKENNESKANSLRKNFVISRSTIFIGGNQNLKGMNLHLIENKKYNNTIHKEITDLKINKTTEKVEINLNESKKDNKDKSINPLDALEAIKKRWKEAEKEYKMRLSFISNNEIVLINKKKYMDDLVNKININSNVNNNNNQEYYILIKQNKKSKQNVYIHEIIVPSSKKELEDSVNKFLTSNHNNNNDPKENFEYSMERVNKRTSQNIIIMNNNKKKSKFNNNKNNEILIKNNEENNSDSSNSHTDMKIKKEEFCPIFILSKEQIDEIFQNVEIKYNKKIGKTKNNINVNSSSQAEKSQKNEILKNPKNEKLTDLNFNLHPVKVEKFEFIHSNNLNEIQNKNTLYLNINNNNIDVSNIALNQSDYNYDKQKIESDYSSQKIKETQDFSQSTPISLLQEKYFVYAVSKWAKYSVVIPQSQIYIKYFYKSGHPKFDPILLDMTNFTLWIEKIRTKKESKKSIPNASSVLSYNSSKYKANSKIGNIRNKSYKTGDAIFCTETNNYSEGNNKFKKKKSKSKSKIDKNK